MTNPLYIWIMKIPILSIITYILIASSLKAQIYKIEFISELNKQAVEQRSFNPNYSFNLAQKAYILSIAIQDSASIALSLKNMGLAHFFNDELDSANYYLSKSLKVYQSINDLVGISATANNLGLIYKYKEDLRRAEHYFLMSLKIDQKIKDTAGIATGLTNLAQIYQIRGEYDQAVTCYKASANMEMLSDDPIGAAESYNDLGVALTENEAYNKSQEYLKLALDIADREGEYLLRAQILNNMGDNLVYLGQFNGAKEAIFESIQIRNKFDDRKGLANSYIHYSHYWEAINKPDSADFYLYEALELCIETDNDRVASLALYERGVILESRGDFVESNKCLLNAYEFVSAAGASPVKNDICTKLASNYAKLGDYENAWKYQKLLSEQTINDIQNGNNRISSEKEIVSQVKITQQSAYNDILFIISGALFAIVLIFSIIILYQRRRLQKTNHLLALQKASAARKERE